MTWLPHIPALGWLLMALWAIAMAFLLTEMCQVKETESRARDLHARRRRR